MSPRHSPPIVFQGPWSFHSAEREPNAAIQQTPQLNTICPTLTCRPTCHKSATLLTTYIPVAARSVRQNCITNSFRGQMTSFYLSHEVGLPADYPKTDIQSKGWLFFMSASLREASLNITTDKCHFDNRDNAPLELGALTSSKNMANGDGNRTMYHTCTCRHVPVHLELYILFGITSLCYVNMKCRFGCSCRKWIGTDMPECPSLYAKTA